MAFTPVFEIILGLWLVAMLGATIIVLSRLGTIQAMLSRLEGVLSKADTLQYAVDVLMKDVGETMDNLDVVRKIVNELAGILDENNHQVQSLDDRLKRSNEDIASIANAVRHLKAKEMQSLEREARKLAAGKK